MPSPVQPEPTTDALERQLDAKPLIEAALSLIGDELRDVVLLIGVAELTYAECADALRIPIGTVRSRYALRPASSGTFSTNPTLTTSP